MTLFALAVGGGLGVACILLLTTSTLMETVADCEILARHQVHASTHPDQDSHQEAVWAGPLAGAVASGEALGEALVEAASYRLPGATATMSRTQRCKGSQFLNSLAQLFHHCRRNTSSASSQLG